MSRPQLENVVSHWSKLIEGLQTSSKDYYAALGEALERRKIPGLKNRQIVWNEGGVLSPKREYLRMTDGRVAFDLCAAPFGTGFFFSWWLVKKPASWVFVWGAVYAVAAWLIRGLLIKGVAFLFAATQGANFWNWVAWRPPLIGQYFRGSSPLIELVLWGLATIAVCSAVSIAARVGRVAAEMALMEIPFFGWVYRTLFAPVTYYRLDTVIMLRSAVHAAVLEAIDGLTTLKGVRGLSDDDRKPIFHKLS